MSYKIAFQELKEETGLVYVHLNKSRNLKQNVKIVDKIGIEHKIDLDNMEFILQKRVELFYPAMENWLVNRDETAIRQGVTSLVHYLAERCKKRIYDKDPNLSTNFGFHDKQAIQIDVGRFSYDDQMLQHENSHREICRITDPLYEWLKEKDPKLAELVIEIRNQE